MRPPSRSLGSLVYLALRRWSPAAGSLAAGSSLVIMALVSIVVLGPWPRWWTGRSPELGRRAGVSRAPRRDRELAARQSDDREPPRRV